MSYTNKPELDIELRHDYILLFSEELTSDQVKAMATDMENLNFNCAIRKDEESKDWQFLVGLNDQEMILREAETQLVLVPRVYQDPDKKKKSDEKYQQQASYLPRKVIQTE